MKRDKIVLGKDYILDGEEISIRRPNNNVLVVGTTGCGKSTSVLLPTMFRTRHSNPVISYAKETDGLKMAAYLRKKGYHVNILDMDNPEKSNVSFNPLSFVDTPKDLDAFCAAVIDMTIKRAKDDYWQAKSKALLYAIIAFSNKIAIENGGTRASMNEALDLFAMMIPVEKSFYDTSDTAIDEKICDLAKKDPLSFESRQWAAFKSLPFKTASCVRDTLESCLSLVFPESVRRNMKNKPPFRAEKFVQRREALIVITSAADTSQTYFANLFYGMFLRKLMRMAFSYENGELPREIRFVFDDFASVCPIENYEHYISLFRSTGISAIMLLQSETQLDKIYSSAGAQIIRQNCSSYVYFPGGFDDLSCDIVAKRMNIPYDEVLYADMGKVFIMQSGRKPVHIERYNTSDDIEYRRYMEAGISGKEERKRKAEKEVC